MWHESLKIVEWQDSTVGLDVSGTQIKAAEPHLSKGCSGLSYLSLPDIYLNQYFWKYGLSINFIRIIHQKGMLNMQAVNPDFIITVQNLSWGGRGSKTWKCAFNKVFRYLGWTKNIALLMKDSPWPQLPSPPHPKTKYSKKTYIYFVWI